MNQEYWVSIWARRRQDEVIRIPADYTIHADFLHYMDKSEAQAAFSELNALFQTIYGDIALNPGEYGMPLNPKSSHRVFSREFSDSGQAPYRPFVLLYNLLSLGEAYKTYKPPPKYLSGIDQNVKHPRFLFDKLSDYGFMFERNIVVTYPDSPNLLYLLKQLADKARNTDRIQDFLHCHFRLLQDDMQTATYGYGADVVADRVTDDEKEFVYALDETLIAMGFASKPYGGIECHGVAYYHSEKDMNTNKPYTYRLITRGMDFEVTDDNDKKMCLQLRIRKVSKCLDYLTSCPDSVKQIFTDYTDTGCAKRANGTCKHGISYEIENKQYWRCACCHTPFSVKPEIADIPHYIKLVELGEMK